MAEPPQLPEHIRRLHGLQLRALIERRGFIGEHLQWHASPERRHRAARPKVSLAPPPATDLSHHSVRCPVEYFGRQGEQISYDEWVTMQKEDWAARESDPVVIDSIGITETIGLAEERFKEIAEDYLTVWATETRGDSAEFAQWLDQLGQAIEGEVGDLWRKDEWHAAWYERACRNKLDEALATLRGEWESHARRLEIQHLKNPQLTLGSLCTADGDLGLAITLDQGRQTLERAHSLLDPPQPTNSAKVNRERLVAGEARSKNEAEVSAPLRVPATTPGGVAGKHGKPAEEPASAPESSRERADFTFGSPSGDRKDPGSGKSTTITSSGSDPRAVIDRFLSKMAENGHRIIRKDIWRLAGYENRTEFERYQRGDKRTTRAAISNFNRILSMEPEDFLRALSKKKTRA